MIKRILLPLAILMFITQVFAQDRHQLNLDQTFWGGWEIKNPLTSCKENYQFKKPSQFVYQVNKKNLSGEFAIVRNSSPEILDILILDIQKDNGLVGCNGDTNNYQGQRSNFSLKWINNNSAEICTDENGQQCTGLFLNKK